MVEMFDDFPDEALKSKVELRFGDIYVELGAAITNGVTYDVVAVFGILYHLMDHFWLFLLIRKLKPKLIIVDS